MNGLTIFSGNSNPELAQKFRVLMQQESDRINGIER